MFERSHLQLLTRRMEEPRRFIQVLLGPRQTGKTTLVTQFLGRYGGGHHFCSADAVGAGDASWLDTQWDTARTLMDQRGSEEFLLVVDEIQKIDDWSELVKRQWDLDTRMKRNLRVILLGSSRLLIQRGLTESLAGRFETIHISHWSFREMHAAFGWDAKQYAWFGGYPGSAGLVEDEVRWKQYVRESLIDTNITRDILMMTRVDKPALMKRLFELGCLYSGQILSYTKLMGQLQDAGNTTTLSHYLNLLDTAGLLTGLEKFSPDVARRRSSSPKFQVYNTALISAQRPERLEELVARPEEWGRQVESAVGSHLLNEVVRADLKLNYWRDGEDEIDFVLERDGKAIGIEVKSGYSQRAKGMQAFQKKYRPYKMLMVGTGGIPWEEFLTWDLAGLF